MFKFRPHRRGVQTNYFKNKSTDTTAGSDSCLTFPPLDGGPFPLKSLAGNTSQRMKMRHQSISPPPITAYVTDRSLEVAQEIKKGSVHPSRSTEWRGGGGVKVPTLPCPPVLLLSKTASSLVCQEAGGSPINTDIVPRRAMHAKKGPLPFWKACWCLSSAGWL